VRDEPTGLMSKVINALAEADLLDDEKFFSGGKSCLAIQADCRREEMPGYHSLARDRVGPEAYPPAD
jgi:hypothetical protein